MLRPLRESFEKNLFPAYRGKIQIIISELKESDAAVLGASALGWEAKYRYEVPSFDKEASDHIPETAK